MIYIIAVLLSFINKLISKFGFEYEIFHFSTSNVYQLNSYLLIPDSPLSKMGMAPLSKINGNSGSQK